jgi:fatty acid desaturase/ferredoxin
MITVGVAARGINLGALVKVRKQRFQRKLVAVIIATSLLTWLTLSISGVVSLIPMILLGLIYAHCVELQHQCLHNTAYRSKRWNRFVGVLLGLPSLVSFSDYQYSHMKHHRLLGTPQDMEFFNYDYKSLSNVWQFIPHLLLVPHHKDVTRSIFNSLLGRLSRGEANPKIVRKIRTEYLLMALMLASMVTISLVFHTWIFVKLWFIPFWIAIPTHALIELPEHFGCTGQTTDVLKNTRSIRASWLGYWFTNGNNYHVEHHWLPAVPNDRFAELHQTLEDGIQHLEHSYFTFYSKFFRHILSSKSKVVWNTNPPAVEPVGNGHEVKPIAAVPAPAPVPAPTDGVDRIYAIDQKRCIRCASCSSIAPAIFYVGDVTAFIKRQPLDAEEVNQCEAALGNCPTGAITAISKSAIGITARS